jgi:hypothetical protein
MLAIYDKKWNCLEVQLTTYANDSEIYCYSFLNYKERMLNLACLIKRSTLILLFIIFAKLS